MLLTLLELWQVLDSIALLVYPLLCDYGPEIPRDIFYPLQVRVLQFMSSHRNENQCFRMAEATGSFSSDFLLGPILTPTHHNRSLSSLI